jgi:uncharacterized protein Usg
MLPQELGHLLRMPGRPIPGGPVPDWHLTTAEILYHLPDHPHLLQSFVWQKVDLAPAFPRLHKFLDFWGREIDGPLHSVRIASAALTRPAELRYADGQFVLN